MASGRSDLPRAGGRPFLTDGGIETSLVFHDGFDLPHFAAYPLLRDDRGCEALDRWFRSHVEIARRHGLGFVLETATWRANSDWGERLGDSPSDLAAANRDAVGLVEQIRSDLAGSGVPMVVSGCVGPRGDGYVAHATMTAAEAERYHRPQLEAFATTSADLATGITMTNVPEAVGLVRAAGQVGLPVVVSFTVEVDGRLPSGDELGRAIEAVDEETDGAPAWFMVNCAHPTHFADALRRGGAWTKRLQGVRANASTKSHAELDEAEELDDGDPDDLARHHLDLRTVVPSLTVFGGCCGTDQRHVAAIAASIA